jgi:flagella basal body P-ring formation protein FlgA
VNYQRPLGKKKTAQLLLVLTLLAWATQTLVHQWGYGQDVEPLTATPDMVAGDSFVTGGPVETTATLEMKSETTIIGPEVKLKQVCRWSDTDAPAFTPIKDLVIERVGQSAPFQSVTVEQVRQTLHDAGVNVATINFVGASQCTITRSDSVTDPRTALQNWIDQHQNPGASTDSDASGSNAPQSNMPADASGTNPQSDASGTSDQTDSSSSTQPQQGVVMPPMTPVAPSALASAQPAAEESKPFHSLRELLTADAAQRLNVPPDSIQMTFNAEDDKVLSLGDSIFKFDIEPERMNDLGPVSWNVTIVSGQENKQVEIRATARAWEDEVVVAKPLAMKEILQASDFTPRHVLVDNLPPQQLLTMDQCVGEAADNDLKPGTVMTARMVDPVPLIRTGQLVTVTLTDGSVQIRSVARAMESGSMGQSVKVRNEMTRDVFDVVVTGVQEARLASETSGAGIASGGN